jgi:hypothetical protein
MKPFGAMTTTGAKRAVESTVGSPARHYAARARRPDRVGNYLHIMAPGAFATREESQNRT